MPDNAIRPGRWQRTDHNASPPVLWVITQQYRVSWYHDAHDSVMNKKQAFSTPGIFLTFIINKLRWW
ncbi:hypothetical protein DLY41_05240 [Escherichia coli]|nr:hypothetical protein [Escherichia coli]EGD5096522.1 hypothetical protein [Escherichia coli]PBQ65515.1 hypothetical protein COD48_25460 [Escherichia coli]